MGVGPGASGDSRELSGRSGAFRPGKRGEKCNGSAWAREGAPVARPVAGGR